MEEYPDGITEAIVVTELMTLLQRRALSGTGSGSSTANSSWKVRGAKDLTRVLAELEDDDDDAISARLLGFDGHKLSIHLDKSSDLELKMCEATGSRKERVGRRFGLVLTDWLAVCAGTSTSASARAQRS